MSNISHAIHRKTFLKMCHSLMEDLNYYLQKAREGKYAIGHFNFASAEQLKAIVQGFQTVMAGDRWQELALMMGTSEGEAEFLGYEQAVGLVDAWRRQTSLPLFLNADHHKTFESCRKAVDAGYDSILIDASKLSYEENVALTSKIKEYAKSKNPAITLEGELGYLKGSSEVQENVEITSEDYTDPAKAANFVNRTGVDRLAVVFGNIHGIVTKQEEKLDIEYLKKIVSANQNVFLVLHGASGLSDEDVRAAIRTGIVNVHINTEIRVAFEKALHEVESVPEPRTTTPYKIMAPTVEAMQRVVEEKLKLFLGN